MTPGTGTTGETGAAPGLEAGRGGVWGASKTKGRSQLLRPLPTCWDTPVAIPGGGNKLGLWLALEVQVQTQVLCVCVALRVTCFHFSQAHT